MAEFSQGRDVRSFVSDTLAASPPRRYKIGGIERRPQNGDFSRSMILRTGKSSLGRQVTSLTGSAESAGRLIASAAVTVLATFAERFGPSSLRSHNSGARALFIDASKDLPPTLLMMSGAADRAEIITDRIVSLPFRIPGPLLNFFPAERGSLTIADEVLRMILAGGRASLLEAMLIAQPQMISARAPTMTRVCAPNPALEIECHGKMSSAGMMCRDRHGHLGVTACYHGTGPDGTPVRVGGCQSQVAEYHEVQDIVFIPLPENFVAPKERAVAGIMSDRAPGQSEKVTFCGAASREVSTYVTSCDAGLLRKRPTLQLRVQTPPATNNGDSGAALIDRDGFVLAFAFERTAFGEEPAMADWIWADNAMGALDLSPV